MRPRHVRRFIVSSSRLRIVVASLALVALLPLADRWTFQRAAAAAEPQRAGRSEPQRADSSQLQSRRSPCGDDPLPPPFAAVPAVEFVVTGAEVGEPGESFVRASGNGTFGEAFNLFGLDIVDGVDVSDIDADGDLDFLIADGRFGDVFLFRNRGQGSFTPERVAAGVSTPVFTLLGNTTNLRIADFNGDGRADFVVGDARTDLGTKVYLQKPNGKFRISDVLDMTWNDAPFGEEGPLVFGVAVGDLNGDRLIDIAILADEGEGAGEVRLYLNQGRGRFSAPILLFNLEQDFGSNLNATGLAGFDLETDGDVDLIVGAGDGNHYVYLNNGRGAFTTPAGPAFVLPGQSGIDAYDADHDGDDDLVAVTIAASQLFYVENLGGTLAAPVAVAPISGFGIGVGAPPILPTAPRTAR
jgi:hypothetical protein